MTDSIEDVSPGQSDDALSFEDAADESPILSIRHLRDTDEQHGDEEVGSTSEQMVFDSSSSTVTEIASPSSVKGGKGKGAGVAALLAKFQNGSADISTAGKSGQSNINGSPRGVRRLAKPSSMDDTSDKTPINANEIGTAPEEAPPEEFELKPEIPPSEGAVSLLEPEGTILNPFAGDKTPVTAALEQFANTGTSHLNDTDVKRYSTASTKEDIQIHPDTPTTLQTDSFSVISLSTPKQSDSISSSATRELNTAEDGLATPTTAQAEFLARQTARLSKVEGEKRSSMVGAEKIKERARELRYGHSRDSSRVSEAGPSVSPTAVVPELLHEIDGKGEDTWEIPLNEGEAIDWDFWGNVMSNYQEIAQTQPRQLSQAIQAGIPGALRGMMWQLMSSSKDEEMEIIYAYYLKQTSPHEKMIRKDLARTFPGQDYFRDGKGIGQENLFNVVKAYSLYDEECGYCQGMQFVVGPLLLNMPDEEAFSTLVRLMKSYDLRGHFIPNMPALQLRLFQFDRLLEETLPLLHRHLTRLGIKSSMYASGWFMTLFTYRSPLDICFRIFDSVFAEGIEALFRFAMALMKKNEDDLLKLTFEEAVPLLAARVFDIYKSDIGEEGHESTRSQEEQSGGAIVSGGYRVNEFIRDAFDFKITAFQLDSYASDFAEQVRVATSHKREMQELKQQNRTLQAKVKDLEDQLGAVQREHVDLVKNVVMAKLAKEEMAEEVSLNCSNRTISIHIEIETARQV
jgi:hypothetical protein